jgi:hypothetical protein
MQAGLVRPDEGSRPVRTSLSSGEEGEPMSRGPGIWQSRVLAELDKDEMFPLVGRFTHLLARRLTQAEVSALHRAAKCLPCREQCRTALVRVDELPVGVGWRSDGAGRPPATFALTQVIGGGEQVMSGLRKCCFVRPDGTAYGTVAITSSDYCFVGSRRTPTGRYQKVPDFANLESMTLPDRRTRLRRKRGSRREFFYTHKKADPDTSPAKTTCCQRCQPKKQMTAAWHAAEPVDST